MRRCSAVTRSPAVMFRHTSRIKIAFTLYVSENQIFGTLFLRFNIFATFNLEKGKEKAPVGAERILYQDSFAFHLKNNRYASTIASGIALPIQKTGPVWLTNTLKTAWKVITEHMRPKPPTTRSHT